MKVIVIGDISGGGNYHLGDEAMSKVAVAELQKRGAEVTIIADRPQISAPLYGVEAVRRFELWRSADRTAKLARMDEILAAVRGEIAMPEAVSETVRAVRSADAVVVAGGGNLNSHMTENHLLERVMLKRIAEHLGIPMYVSSQTVGPVVTAEDRVLLRELAGYARVFGAREQSTAALMREICGDLGTVVQTLDDVILMDPSEDRGAVESLDLPAAYVVGSFTMHSGSTGFSREEYYRRIAEMLDSIALRFAVDVLLLPHMGKLHEDNRAKPNTDVFGHDRIERYSTSGRLRSFEMMSSQDLARVTAGARFTLSTRYHPVVFGAGLGVPAIGLITSYYSAVRMRGALANVGMESLAIPFEHWTPVFGAPVLDTVEHHSAQLSAHVEAVSAAQRAYQSRWWDGIVADAAGTGDVVRDDLVAPVPFEWGQDQDRRDLELARLAQEKTNLEILRADVDRLARDRDTAQVTTQFERAERELAELRATMAQMRHRMRPPGAGIRDWIRNRGRRSQ